MARKFTIILYVVYMFSQANSQEAILHVSDGSSEKEYCLVYNSSWTTLSTSLSNAVQYQLVNLTSTFLCSGSGVAPDALRGRAVVVMRGECDITKKALVAQDLGALAVLIASKTTMLTPSANETDYGKVKIPLALMRYRDILDAQQRFPDGMAVSLYAPLVPVFDISLLIMLILSIFTVAMGAYWSGISERDRLNECTAPGSCEGKGSSGDLSLYSPLKVIIFVALMSTMLVLMYFFYTWLVYVIIAVFCLASAMALYSCLEAVMERIGCGSCNFSCLGKDFSVRSLLLAAVSVAVAVVWGVYRNEDRWIWILQDLLGIAFCLNFMKTITVSNFKVCVILLSLLVLYDVFFVFITPFFTPNGVSIMVQVALGPGSTGEKSGGNMVEVPAEPTAPHEKLPVVMRVPRFSAWAQNLCGMQFSILGYGDIIVPGLLVAYCHKFDVWTSSSKKIYFVSCTIAYFFGMIVTFAVMIVSKMGQPALLYLVPFTLLTSAVVAWRRKEMRHFWTGNTYEVLDSSTEPLLQDGGSGCDGGGKC
ncbi:hypothetical protein SKAU_G00350360 [Synaphobranchus kaupii]|uniref:PA domain-containing protein n=1 Tax=Synaphobranchus kaupii TaxID=118154 RepID=A0A9Q1EKD9_SYNKA|nr:hypothetical protein SKAU_G00350360 [Synaphobranchus kaupii]